MTQFKRTQPMTRLAAALLASLALLPAHAVASCAALEPVPAVLEVVQGMQREMRYPVAIQRLAVGDPEVADVRLVGRNGFLLTGKKGGATNVTVWTSCSSEPRQSMVFVQGAATMAVARPVLPQYDEPELLSQVQTDIQFVEVNRTKLREIGVSLFGGSNSKNFLFGAPGTVSSATVGSVAGSAVGATLGLPDSGFNILWGGGSNRVLGALNALEGSGFAYTLARPSLVAMSGKTASFLAGGEFPVPIPSSGSDSVSIEYKEFGVRLNLTPTVVSADRITLKVAPEVSELDFTAGVTIQGTSVPALNVRRTDTTVSLADGESFVISGLLSARNTSAVEKLPGLGNLPVLGAFFRSSRIDREERELLMIVTPRLVRPLASDARLPQLPGESLRQYDPNVIDQVLFEDGRFDGRTGLSR